MFLFTLYLSVSSFLIVSSTASMPSTPGTVVAPQAGAPAPADSCQALTNPKHIALAAALSGNERILFCSIFDDTQRDQVIIYTEKKPPFLPKDAVIQVGKDSDLLFSTKPGGACGAH